jgi:biotin operon repressor
VSDFLRRGGPRFSVVPEDLIRDPEVTDRAFRVWCRLDRYAGKSEAAFPSVEQLATDLDCSEPSIKRATKNLRDAGWMTRKQRRGGSAVYTVQMSKTDHQ